MSSHVYVWQNLFNDLQDLMVTPKTRADIGVVRHTFHEKLDLMMYPIAGKCQYPLPRQNAHTHTS